VLGRSISFGDTAYVINTIALQCTNVLGTIVLGRVISLGDSQHHRHDSTPTYKRTWRGRVGRVINLGGTTNTTGTIIHVTL
jgi:hypothetical protein